MSTWLIWIRRSYAQFFLIVPVALAVVLRASEPDQDFRFEWQWTTAVAGEWLVFGGAIIAGVTAWETWLTRRRLASLQAGRAHPHRGLFAVWAGAATWWGALHAVILSFYVAIAATAGAIGDIPLLVICLQFVAIGGFCALGALFGWFVRWPFTGPLVTVFLIAVVLSGAEAGNILWFTSASSLLGWQPVTFSFLAQTAAFLGITLLVLAQLLPVVAKRALIAAGLALSALAAVTASQPDRHYWEATSAQVTCKRTEREFKLCGISATHPLFKRLSAELAPVVRDLQEMGVQTPASYTIVAGESRIIRHLSDGIFSVGAVNGVRKTPQHILIRAATIQPNCIESTGTVTAAREHQAILYGWVLREFGEDDPGRYPLPVVQEIRKLDRKTQLAWFREAYRKAWQCAQTGFTYPPGIIE